MVRHSANAINLTTLIPAHLSQVGEYSGTKFVIKPALTIFGREDDMHDNAGKRLRHPQGLPQPPNHMKRPFRTRDLSGGLIPAPRAGLV